MVDENHLVVVVEIAGMRDNDFNVALVNQQLSISGTRPAQERAQAAYHQLEVRYGEFRVDVSLPWPVDEAQVTARYDDGFLKVELPRARPHQITVVDVEKPLAD
jgi:HSP20 family molecular chaperone IbpA